MILRIAPSLLALHLAAAAPGPAAPSAPVPAHAAAPALLCEDLRVALREAEARAPGLGELRAGHVHLDDSTFKWAVIGLLVLIVLFAV